MAELCLDCWNKINKSNLKRYHVVLFKDLDMCEECGEWKRCIARYNLLGNIADELEMRKRDKERKKDK